MGRPTKLTPETHKAIVDALRVGATYELASAYGGISYESFLNWMKRGKRAKEHLANGGKPVADEASFLHFFEDVKLAEGKAAVGWLAKIEAAATAGEWQAAAWKLERRYPEHYGRRTVEVTGAEGGPLVLKVVYENKRQPATDDPLA